MTATPLDLALRRLRPFLEHTPAATVLELGAYDGRHAGAIRALFCEPPAAWYAFEADPRNVKRCSAAPVYQLPGAELIPCAIGAADGTLDFHPSTDAAQDWAESSSLMGPTHHMAQAFPWLQYRKPIQVPVRSLDSFRRERRFERVDLLWCDIEGAERLMIQGGPQTLARTKYLYLEVWQERIYRGMWTYPELLAHLPGWEIVERFPGDVLLHHVPQKPRKLAALTSIKPGDNGPQRRAVASWAALGLDVVSLNHESEIPQLQREHPGVDFVPVASEAERYGRHYVAITTILKYARQYLPHTWRLIINADCELASTPAELERACDLIGPGIGAFIRHDYPKGEPHKAARTHRAGIDACLFGPDLDLIFEPSPLALGTTAWDYWLPIRTMQLGLPMRVFSERLLLHEIHEQRWSRGDLQRNMVELERLTGGKLTAVEMFHILTGPRHHYNLRPTCHVEPRTAAPRPAVKRLAGARSALVNDNPFPGGFNGE